MDSADEEAVVKYLYVKGLPLDEIIAEIENVLELAAPSRVSVDRTYMQLVEARPNIGHINFADIRSMIKFYYTCSMPLAQMYAEFRDTLSADYCPPRHLIREWYNLQHLGISDREVIEELGELTKFNNGLTNNLDKVSNNVVDALNDANTDSNTDTRSATSGAKTPIRRLIVSEETLEEFRALLATDRKVKIHDIASSIGLTIHRVEEVMDETLELTTMATVWAPQIITEEQRQQRLDLCLKCTAIYQQLGNDEFMRRYLTADEWWIQFTDPTMKDSGTVAIIDDDTPPPVKYTDKVQMTIFWDATGAILIDFVATHQQKDDDYYFLLLNALFQKVQERRASYKNLGVLFHHDENSIHSSERAIRRLSEFGWDVLPFISDTPDLFPSCYHINKRMFDEWLQNTSFSSHADVEYNVRKYFSELNVFMYESGVDSLPQQWAECIERNGLYVDD